MSHTFLKLCDVLNRIGIAHDRQAANLIAVPLRQGLLSMLSSELVLAMGSSELRDTRSLILEDDAQPGMSSLSLMQPLSTLVAQVQGQWLTAIIRECRLTSHFQPIVETGNPNHVFAYECLLRGLHSDGSLVSPDHLYHVARGADQLFSLDRLARLTAIRTAVVHGLDKIESSLFINFNPTSIYDPVYCLQSTMRVISESLFRPAQIVFEIVESDRIEDVDHLVKIVKHYRDAGFKVALDDLGSGYGSLSLLSRLKPDFVKFDMNLMRNVHQDPYKAGIVLKLLEMTQSLGVTSIAEGIETQEEWEWVRHAGADYVQGYLFARPARIPPIVTHDLAMVR